MQIYLPIAEMSVSVFLLLGLGGFVGFLSGLFGVGGGFLMTPLLIFWVGVAPPVAVATEANQIVAASVSGVIAHWRRGNVDFRMGAVLLTGGLAGSTFGVWLYSLLRDIGQLDLVITLAYVVFLGTIGSLMLVEAVRTTLRLRHGAGGRKLHQHTWLHGLPFKLRFRKSKLYISALLPLGIGFFVGILSAIMGVGGGFVMVPAMIYLLGMPTTVVVGTSLFQIIFVTAYVTFLQAVSNQTVDVLLAVVLLTGGVIGAQIGSRYSGRLPAAHLRGLLALLVIAVCLRLVFDLVTEPDDLYFLGRPGVG